MRKQRLLVMFVFAWLFITGCTSWGGIGCSAPCKPGVPYPQPGACPIPGVPDNQPGGHCKGIWPCGNGSQCVDGTCLPCGGDGEICCGPNKDCNGGACEYNSNGPDICSTSCGTLGKACCNGNNCEGSVCDLNTHQCVAGGGGACSGPYTYVVSFINKQTRCAEYTFYVKSSSDADAQTCAQGLLQGQTGNVGLYELGPLNVEPTEYVFCEHSAEPLSGPDNNIYPLAFSQQDAEICAVQAFCQNCTFTPGQCQ